ncbi:MAG: hypothetical protein CMJ78_08920 [Planctomycetaceae bacterium]|nr:hypothetical protein [Planctomycetaceae bacterium]
MKAATVPIVIFLVIVALIAVISLGRGGGDAAEVETVNNLIPTPSKTGPHPSASFDSTEHVFGTMHQGQEGEHSFIVTNEGEAPLQLVARQEDTTCQCTVGSVGKNGLAPGESTEITLTWKIKSALAKFHHSAKLRTNDPNQPTVVLHIKGKVGKLLRIRPHTEWPTGAMPDGEEVTLTGTLHSEIVDAFEITEIESNSEHVGAAWKVIPKNELSKLIDLEENKMLPPGSTPQKQEITEPRCGYDVTVTVKPTIEVGPFRKTLTIHTDVKDAETLTLHIYGNRAGPMEFFAKAGTRWFDKFMVADLGRFKASEGKKGGLMLYIKKHDGQPVEVVPDSIVTEPSFIKCTVTRDEEFKSQDRDRFDVNFEVPAGTPVKAFNRDKYATVQIKTTHPDAKEMLFKLYFNSY